MPTDPVNPPPTPTNANAFKRGQEKTVRKNLEAASKVFERAHLWEEQGNPTDIKVDAVAKRELPTKPLFDSDINVPHNPRTWTRLDGVLEKVPSVKTEVPLKSTSVFTKDSPDKLFPDAPISDSRESSAIKPVSREALPPLSMFGKSTKDAGPLEITTFKSSQSSKGKVPSGFAVRSEDKEVQYEDLQFEAIAECTNKLKDALQDGKYIPSDSDLQYVFSIEKERMIYSNNGSAETLDLGAVFEKSTKIRELFEELKKLIMEAEVDGPIKAELMKKHPDAQSIDLSLFDTGVYTFFNDEGTRSKPLEISPELIKKRNDTLKKHPFYKEPVSAPEPTNETPKTGNISLKKEPEEIEMKDFSAPVVIPSPQEPIPGKTGWRTWNGSDVDPEEEKDDSMSVTEIERQRTIVSNMRHPEPSADGSVSTTSASRPAANAKPLSEQEQLVDQAARIQQISKRLEFLERAEDRF